MDMYGEINYYLLGAVIKEKRKERKMTQEKLAEMVGISHPHMCNIERGSTKVSLQTLVRLANALNTTADGLLAGNQRYDEYGVKGETNIRIERCKGRNAQILYKVINAVSLILEEYGE